MPCLYEYMKKKPFICCPNLGFRFICLFAALRKKSATGELMMARLESATLYLAGLSPSTFVDSKGGLRREYNP